jgi:hypothetical protein
MQPTRISLTEAPATPTNRLSAPVTLLRRAIQEWFPPHEGWRERSRTASGVRLRRDHREIAVAHLEAVDTADPDPLRALFAALGRLVVMWEDPPGLQLVLVLPDTPAWCTAATQLTVRPGRLFGVKLLAVDPRRPAWVRTLDLWGTTWFGGVGSDEREV